MINIQSSKALNTSHRIPKKKPLTPHPTKPKKTSNTSQGPPITSPAKLGITNNINFLNPDRNRRFDLGGPVLDDPKSYCDYYKTNIRKRNFLGAKANKNSP
jgi:hypothetical protein